MRICEISYKSLIITDINRQQLDYRDYHFVIMGFTLLTTGILSRAAWANQAPDFNGIGVSKKPAALLLGPYS